MDIKSISTPDLIAELVTREGVDWSEVQHGLKYEYVPPQDGHFIIVPKNAIPHKETLKERFMRVLFENYENGDKDAGNMLITLMTGGR